MTASLSDQVAAAAAKARGNPTSWMQGVCLARTAASSTVTVGVAGTNYSMPALGVLPNVGDTVFVAFLQGTPVCLGGLAPAPTPAVGTVAAVPSGSTITVTGSDGVTYLCSYDPNVTTWSVGQLVLLDWTSKGPAVILKLSKDPTPTPTGGGGVAPPVVKPTGATTRDFYFMPAWSGTQNGSGDAGAGAFWTNQVYCGTTTLAGWGYDTSPASLPDSAIVNGCWIYVDAVQSSGSSPTFGTHTLGSRAGVLAVSGSAAASLGSGWKQLPVSYAAALIRGTARGIATHHGGYSIYSPAGTNNSGRLRINATAVWS